MDRQAADGECWVRCAEFVDIEDHGEQYRRGEGGMHDEAEQVVADGYAGRCSAKTISTRSKAQSRRR